MASSLIGFSQKQKQQQRASEDTAKLKEENRLLAKQLEESRRREAEILQDLQKALLRVKIAEEGEEMLCNQLAQLEAEFVHRELAFNQQIRLLQQQQDILPA